MKQIKFLDYKINDKKLVLYLGDKQQVVIWSISLNKPLRGHVHRAFPLLRRSLYDLAYYVTTDPDKRNVIMDALWYIWEYPRTRTVWVRDSFLDELNEELINMSQLYQKLFELVNGFFSLIDCCNCHHYYDENFDCSKLCNNFESDGGYIFWKVSEKYAHDFVEGVIDIVTSEIYEDKCTLHTDED